MGHPWAPIPSTQPSGQRVWLGTNTPVWRNTVERVAEIFQKGKHGSRYAINYMYVAMVNENDIQLVFKELPKAQRTEQRSLYSWTKCCFSINICINTSTIANIKIYLQFAIRFSHLSISRKVFCSYFATKTIAKYVDFVWWHFLSLVEGLYQSLAHSQGRHSLPHDEADEEEENDRHYSLFRMMIND